MRGIKFVEDGYYYINNKGQKVEVTKAALFNKILRLPQCEKLYIFNETTKETGNYKYYLINSIRPMNYNADYILIRIEESTKKSCIFIGAIQHMIDCLQNNVVDNSELFVFSEEENEKKNFYVYKQSDKTKELERMILKWKYNNSEVEKAPLFNAFLYITEQYRTEKDASFEIWTEDNKCLIKI